MNFVRYFWFKKIAKIFYFFKMSRAIIPDMADARYSSTELAITHIQSQFHSNGQEIANVENEVQRYRKRLMEPLVQQCKRLKRELAAKQNLLKEYSYQIKHPFFGLLESLIQSPHIATLILQHLSVIYCIHCKTFVPRQTDCLVCHYATNEHLDHDENGNEFLSVQTNGSVTMTLRRLEFDHPNDLEIESEIQRFQMKCTSDTPSIAPLCVAHNVKGGTSQTFGPGLTLGIMECSDCVLILLPHLKIPNESDSEDE